MVEGPAVPLPEAAARLGLSPEAIRMRVRRGTLTGVKHAGRLHIVLPDLSEPFEQQPVAFKQPSQQRSNAIEQPRDRDELVTALRSEVDYLRAALEREQTASREALEREQIANAELRRLLGNAQQQLGELVRQLPRPRGIHRWSL